MKKVMGNTKDIKYTCICMLVCIAMNCIGRCIAIWMQLPLWLDSVGTGIAACLLGPVCGALCGVTANIALGYESSIPAIYWLTSIAIGMVIGICMKKGMLKDKFGVCTVSVLVAFTAVAISTPLNCIFFQGDCGNVWGNGLFDMLRHLNVPRIPASALGQLFVDFPDKLITMWCVYGILQIPVLRKIAEQAAGERVNDGNNILTLLLSATVVVSVCMTDSIQVQAAESQDVYSAFYTETVYNSANGLPGGAANDIEETKDGYLWVGTYSGLYRYDGSAFASMPELESIKSVNCLYIDEEGRLWIGTNDNGLSIYVRDKISNVLNEESGLSSNSIRCIKEDKQGNYYVGTSDALCIITISNGLKIRKTLPDINYANSISVSEDGMVAIVTNAGELFLLQDTKVIKKYASPVEEYYTCCQFTPEGELLIGTTSNKVYRWDGSEDSPEKGQVIHLGSRSYVCSIERDEKGYDWICTDSGIGYLNREGEYHDFEIESFNNSVDNMTIDYQGNLWFTSSRLGLLKLSRACFSNLYRLYGMEENVVNTVTEWENLMYFGTDTGLEIVDEKTGEEVQNELRRRLEGIRIRCLMVDSKNHLWVATSGGEGLLEVFPDFSVNIYNPENGTIDNRFRSLLEMADGTVAVAENTGINFIKDGEVIAGIEKKDGMENPQILTLAEKEDGTLLAGSDGSGIFIIKDFKIMGHITNQDGLTSGVILRMVPLEKGYLIVTSNSLCYLDENNQCSALTSFPYSNNYDAVVGEDGKIWILGSAGIYIVSQKKLITNQIVNYELLDGKKGLEDALTVNAWNYIDGESNFYLACSTGVYQVNMNSYDQFKPSYRMGVESVTADGVEYEVDRSETIKISGNPEKIVIIPAALNYTMENPYVSYYLEGFEKNPNVVRMSELGDIVYTNLPFGTYTFCMSILDDTKTEEIESTSYILEKQAQFWENWWFKCYLAVICMLGVAYVTWLVTRLNMNRIIARQNQEIALARKQAQMGNETILAIAKTVDAKDENTSQHSERVAEYSVQIAKRLGWSEEQCDNLRQIALLHDIGKIGIPDAVLNKPARLTDEEYAIMKSHVEIGAKILKDFTIVEHVADGVRYHHEKYDGTGYIRGLKGEEIPLNARIIGIADAFDAMTANRVYRKRLEMDYVMAELRRCSGTQFDPQMVQILIELVEEGTINPVANYEEESV